MEIIVGCFVTVGFKLKFGVKYFGTKERSWVLWQGYFKVPPKMYKKRWDV